VYLYVHVSTHLWNKQQLFPCTTLTGLYNLDRVSSLRGPGSLNNIRLISLPKGLKNESEVYEDNLRRRSTLSPLNVTYAQAVNCYHAGAFCSSMSARAPGCNTLVGKPLYTARNGGRTPVRCSLQHECCQNGPPATTTPSPSDRHGRGWRGETGRSYKLSPHVRSGMTTRWENDTCYYNTPKVNIFVGAITEEALLFFILPHKNVRYTSHDMQFTSKHIFVCRTASLKECINSEWHRVAQKTLYTKRQMLNIEHHVTFGPAWNCLHDICLKLHCTALIPFVYLNDFVHWFGMTKKNLFNIPLN